MKKRRKINQAVKPIKKNLSRSVSDAMLAAVDADIDPFSVIPTGSLSFDNPSRKRYYKKWRLGANVDDLYHMFSLLARNHTIAEITEDFILHYLDWNKIKEVGAKQAAKNQLELLELKSKYETIKDAGDTKWKNELVVKIASFVEVKASNYGRDLVDWLKRAVENAIHHHRPKWACWIAEERRLWMMDKTRSAPSAEKSYRLTMYDRLLEYEWSQEHKNSKAITEILKAIKDEVEGHTVTVQWNVEDVSDSIMAGTMTRDDWLEVIGVIQRMLIASVKGETVEDIRRLVADTYGSDLVIDAEEYLEEKGL